MAIRPHVAFVCEVCSNREHGPGALAGRMASPAGAAGLRSSAGHATRKQKRSPAARQKSMGKRQHEQFRSVRVCRRTERPTRPWIEARTHTQEIGPPTGEKQNTHIETEPPPPQGKTKTPTGKERTSTGKEKHPGPHRQINSTHRERTKPCPPQSPFPRSGKAASEKKYVAPGLLWQIRIPTGFLIRWTLL